MTLGSHQTTIGQSQVHLTPQWLVRSLGAFDLDPCAASPRPWDCAAQNITEAEDGLAQPWKGRVWLNPPFDRRVVAKWIERLAQHGDGIALIHARTETAWFRPVWQSADAIFFLANRVKFCLPTGAEQQANSGAPPVLAIFGADNQRAVQRAGIPGYLVTTWKTVAR